MECIFVWAIYYIVGLIATEQPPIWAAAAMIVLTDKAVDRIRSHLERPSADEKA